MTAPVTVRERDLRALAGIVSEDRPDVPTEEGLPPSLARDTGALSARVRPSAPNCDYARTRQVRMNRR
jgi:hypothetical protein